MTNQNEGIEGGWLKQFWAIWRGWVLLALFLLAVVIVLGVLGLTGVIDTGFGEYVPDASMRPAPERAKTLWDWMDLLLVPLVLALGASLFTWVTNKRERDAEEKRITEQREIEGDRSRDAALQTYLDRVSALLRGTWRESGKGFLEANIIRAQTLTVLRQLDGRRNDLIFRFLRESGLMVREAVVTLSEADLSETDLSGADLRWADVSGANLSGTDLRGADLRGADLREANLSGADLLGTDLREAYLSGANLSRAILSEANLRGADLSRADLREAKLRGAWLYEADLSGANLSGADLSRANLRGAGLSGATVTKEQLAQAASLEGVTLPDGTVHE